MQGVLVVLDDEDGGVRNRLMAESCKVVGERVVRVDEEYIVSCHRHHKPSSVLEISSKIGEELSI